ncbi:MAG: formate/nitrite transporter family protein [Clostridia bacterium]|nr:formate/nitrite transporter family protein [Clostridia bacterium]
MNVQRGVLAGILISIGGFAFLQSESRVVGAFLFSIGLIGVVLFECSLYTGRVGYWQCKKDAASLAFIFLKNVVGTALCGLALRGAVGEQAAALMAAKLAMPLGESFVRAVFCGIMIYIGVDLYKLKSSLFLLVLPVMVFILCGMEHSVANAFYLFAAGTYTLRAVLFILVCVAGNAVGSLAIRFLKTSRKLL